MNTTRNITLSTVFGIALVAASSPTLAAQYGLPSSTDWQAWNTYVAKPSQHMDMASRVPASRGLPSSTDWQAWNSYVSQASDGMNQPKVASASRGLPASTDWHAWNAHFNEKS
jgi:hypothetical protein